MKIKFDFDLKVGKVVQSFIVMDFLFIGGWGLINPLFSVFIIQDVKGATLATVGIVAAIYWLVKSAIQLPIANYLDKTDGEKDDFYALFGGLMIAALCAFSFAFVHQIWQLFLAQFLYAIAMGFYIPAWSGIFSRHLDKNRFSFDWSLDSTVIGIATGITGLFSGFIAAYFGYQTVFFMVGILTLLAAFFIFRMSDFALPPRSSTKPIIKDHIPSNIGR